MELDNIKIFFTHDEALIRRAVAEIDPLFPVGIHGSPDPEEKMNKLLRFADVVVAMDGDNVAGFAAIYANNMETRLGYMPYMGVAEAYQGHHLAVRFMEACEALARERGMTRVRMEVSDSNQKIVRFHSRRGYVRIGATEEGCSHMERPL